MSTVSYDGNVAIVKIDKNLTLGPYLEEISSLIQEIFDEGIVHIIIDLEQTTFIDSRAIGTLISLGGKYNKKNELSKIVCCSPTIRAKSIFDRVRFSTIVPVFKTKEEALQSFYGRSSE